MGDGKARVGEILARVKVCKSCNVEFTPVKPMQAACSTLCALRHSKLTNVRAREKAQRKADRKRKQAIKSRSDWMKETQVEFNKYIRARDTGRVCISCGCIEQDRFTGGYFDCGHYRSTGAAAHLRFNFINARAQCKKCNRDLSGNVVAYRVGLVARIGRDRVDLLEHDNRPRTFTIEYLKRAKALFKRRAKHYRKLRGIE